MMKRYPSLIAYLAGPPRRTQEELAERLSRRAGFRVRQGTVAKWVRGDTMPRPQMALLIEAETGVSVGAMNLARARKVAA
jgi:transcriptional regulator with XRE-family HTH domain